MIDVNGRLHSTEKNVNVIAGADEILDDSKNKKQNEINTETYSLVNDINERLNGLSPDQQSALSVAAKATNNEIKLGYYVCGTEGNIAAKVISDATGYTLSTGGSIKVKMTNANTADNATLNINSTGAKPLFYDGERASANNTWEAGETVEVYYDGTNFYANNVAGSGGEGVFDVSEKYPTSGVEGGNTYTLEGALTVLNTNLPTSKKKGGMGIKFVQSSDNKYVQWRLTTSTWSADPNDWVAENEDFRNEVMQEVNEAIEANTPIVVEGNVNNVPDEEDLTSVNQDGTDVLKFKDKAYTPLTYSGMGRVYLRKNIVNGVNILNRDMFYKGEVDSRVPNTNTIFIIQYDFTLGENLTVPADCVLQFDGGSIANASGNNYTLTCNDTIINSPFTDECITNVELLGTFEKNIRKNSVYIIDNKTFGITEGYFEKDANGHYSQAQYDAMYNNGVGFTNALNYAKDNGYNGVQFKKGTYCFCPFGSTVATFYGSIQVQDFEYFDINLNGSELRLLIDSSTKSPYITYNPSSVWFIKHCLFRLVACNHVSIHNGTLIGDKLERSFTNTSETWEELTYGIMVGGFCFYTSIYDIDASYFMGDAFDVHGVLTPMVSYTQEGFGASGWTVNIGNIYQGGYKSNNNTITTSDDSGKAMTGYIDLSNITYYNTMNFKVINDMIKRRIFCINNMGGYNRVINAYMDDIIIVTFASEDGEPIRYVPCSYLENFELEEGENGIRLITLYNYDITEEGINPQIRLTNVVSYNVLIKNCEIRNNHRGGISGGCNDVTVEGCVFYKSLINPFPDPTDYCINFEDTQGNYLLVHNCDFSGVKSVKNRTRNQGRIIYSGKKLVVADCTLCEAPLIYHAVYADIYGCTIQKGIPVGGGCFLDSESHNGWTLCESAKSNKRFISIHNNKILQGTIVPTGRNTIIDTHDNFINIEGVSGNLSNIGLGVNNWHDNEIYGIIGESGNNTLKLPLPTKFFNNHVYNKPKEIDDASPWFSVDLYSTDTEIQHNYNYIHAYVVVALNMQLEYNIISGMHFLKNSGLYMELKHGDVKYNIRIENVIIDSDARLFDIVRHGLNAEPTNNVDILFKNCVISKQLRLLSNSTYAPFIHSLSFENCDFSGNPDDAISNSLSERFVETLKFNNCKFRNGQKLSDFEPSILMNSRGLSSERPVYVENGFVYIDITLGKPIYKDTSSQTGWIDATGKEV